MTIASSPPLCRIPRPLVDGRGWAALALGAGLLLSSAGCNSAADGAATTTSAPPPAAAAPSGKAVPDLTKEFQEGQCEEIKGSAVPGADSYFHGEFAMTGDVVTGHETWWLAANKAWEGAGGNSCTIRWSVTGTKVAPRACTDCDFGFMLSATPEPGSSKCPEGLLKREARPQQLAYDIKLAPSGEAFVYYAKTGNLLGEGFHADGKIAYRTQHQCKWF